MLQVRAIYKDGLAARAALPAGGAFAELLGTFFDWSSQRSCLAGSVTAGAFHSGK
ncbi:hypothetical protein AB2M62_05145 [Sphingomonas sp. MMS12-HWE2-04]|uniref:hypothetical protein n=1 Tax=Sphingomonas sp. MMS12-HWE2-04 TaxID=3234199 RepID=UPI0038506067